MKVYSMHLSIDMHGVCGGAEQRLVRSMSEIMT